MLKYMIIKKQILLEMNINVKQKMNININQKIVFIYDTICTENGLFRLH